MPSNRKGGSWCSVYGCRNNSNMNKNISFFRYPKNVERSKAWIHATGRTDLLKKGTEYAYKNCRVCARHFQNEMFANDLKNRLLSTAVPKIITSDDELTGEAVKNHAVESAAVVNIAEFQRPNDFFDNDCQETKTYHELQTVINFKFDDTPWEEYFNKINSYYSSQQRMPPVEHLDETSIQNKRIYAKCDVCNKKMLSTNYDKHKQAHNNGSHSFIRKNSFS